MSEIKEILEEIADRLAVYPVELMTVKLRTVTKMLDFVPSYSQKDAIKAAFDLGEVEDA